MEAGSLWGGDGGLGEGVGRPEQSSGCVLKADPTVGWLWVMTEENQHGAATLLPAGPVGPAALCSCCFCLQPPGWPLGALALTLWGFPMQCPTAFPSHHKFPRQKLDCWGPVSNPLHPAWTEGSYSEVVLLGRAVDRAVTSNNHSVHDSWCTGGRVGRPGRRGIWQALNLKGKGQFPGSKGTLVMTAVASGLSSQSTCPVGRQP